MAIYHFSAQIISRGKGRSSVAAAAYRSGEKMEDERTGLVHDYTRKDGLAYSEILLPNNAPEWFNDRQKLWNEVERIEKNSNSQLAREINIALPKELSKEQNIELIREFVKDNFVSKGMVADIAIHDKNNDDKSKVSVIPLQERDNNKNIHAHVMLTMRPLNEDGTWGAKSKKEYILNKNGEKIYSKKGNPKSIKIELTNWNDKETLENWREKWADYTNKALEKAGSKEQIDHRTLEAQGIKREAQIHVGVNASALEKKGVETDRGNINEDIKEDNRQLNEINKKLKEIKDEKVILLGEYKKVREEKNRADFYWKQFNSNDKDILLKTQNVLNKYATIENIKSGNSFIDKKINFWDGLQQKLTKKMNPYEDANNILSKLKNTREEYKKAAMFSQERRELKNSISELESNFKKQTDYLQRYSNSDLKTENKFEKAYKQLSESELKKRASYSKGIEEWTDKKEILFKAESILKENELKKLIKAYPECEKFRNNLNEDTACSINEINRIMHKKLTLDEIRQLGDKSQIISNENKRLLQAEKNLKEYDKLMEISKKYEKGLGSVKKLFSNNKENEYKEVQQKINSSKNNLKNCNVINREDLKNQREKLNKQVEDLPSSFRNYELKNKDREFNGKSYQLYKQEEQYKKASNIINDLKENRDKLKGINFLLHDNKEVKQKIHLLEEKFKKCNVGIEKDFEKNSSIVIKNIENKKNNIAEQRKEVSQNLDLSTVYKVSLRARNGAVELQNKMLINEHYNKDIKELGKVVNGNNQGSKWDNERNIGGKEFNKTIREVSKLGTRGEANPGRNYNFNGKLGGLSTEGNRHIEISPTKLGGHNEKLQGANNEGERNNNTEIQRNGGSNQQINSNDTRQFLERTAGRIEEGKRDNAINQDGNNTRNKTDDREISTKDRTSIFSKDSNSIFNSRFKSSLSANIQDSATLDKEILRQIDENKKENCKPSQSKEESIKEENIKEKDKCRDKER